MSRPHEGLSTFLETSSPTDAEEIRAAARRWRILFVLTAAIVVAAVWGAWFESTAYEKRQAMSDTARRQANMAVTAEHFAVRVLRNAETVNRFVARARLGAPSREAFSGIVDDRARNNDALAEILVCFDDGSVITSGNAAGPRRDWCEAWRRETAALGAGTLIAPQLERPGGAVVPVANRMPDKAGEAGGIVVSLVGVNALLGLLMDYRTPEATVVLLAGLDGLVRARWASRTGTAVQRGPEAALVAGFDGGAPATASIRELDARRIVYSTRPVRGYPLGVAVSTDEKDVLADSRRRAVAYGVACLVATLLLGLLAAMLWRQYARSGRMAESLGRARERLQALNADLEHKVAQRTGELEHAYHDLESFSYTVAHDVRAPLAAIRGFADAMAPAIDATGDTRLAHYLKRIHANAVQMSEFTESLLALGKLTRAPVAPAPIDVSAMAEDVLQDLRATDPGRAVDAEVQPGLHAMGDRVLVRHILENLLGNAWKFTANKSPAVIRVFAGEGVAPGWMAVSIADNGAGFDMDSASDLFKPFRRMHTASEFPGTGVGLATVQRIVRLHGGRVWLQSRPGAGATASFTLPAPTP